jgi:hypothetical protein
MHFTIPIAIFISGEFAPPVVDTFMAISPFLQAGINTVLVRTAIPGEYLSH